MFSTNAKKKREKNLEAGKMHKNEEIYDNTFDI